jgi:hypothetical protein
MGVARGSRRRPGALSLRPNCYGRRGRRRTARRAPDAAGTTRGCGAGGEDDSGAGWAGPVTVSLAHFSLFPIFVFLFFFIISVL